jgi:glycosyltransferase involved in cell wall biosynthesis
MPDLSIDLIVVGALSLFVLIQLAYFLILFSRLAFYKHKETNDLNSNLPVSIIICAFNEEANLVKNLPLLLEQDYMKNGKPNFEVLVVNHNSEDDTFYLLNRMREQYPHLSVLNLTQEAKLIQGKKFPLSMGIKQAAFEHMLLTDADCVPQSNKWLALMANAFTAEKKIVLGYSPYVRYPGALNRAIRFETTHSAIQYFSYALSGIPYMGVGRNLAYVKTLFNQNKGFSAHNHITSGDDDLFINQVATASNTAVVIHEDAFTYSEPKRTEEEWFVQKGRHLSTGKYYKSKHKFLLGLYAFSHFGTWVSFWLSLIFYKFVLVAAIIFLVRWIIQWFIFQRCFRLLHAHDLINWIPYFDFWYLAYNVKNAPSIFFKTQKKWK